MSSCPAQNESWHTYVSYFQTGRIRRHIYSWRWKPQIAVTAICACVTSQLDGILSTLPTRSVSSLKLSYLLRYVSIRRMHQAIDQDSHPGSGIWVAAPSLILGSGGYNYSPYFRLTRNAKRDDRIVLISTHSQDCSKRCAARSSCARHEWTAEIGIREDLVDPRIFYYRMVCTCDFPEPLSHTQCQSDEGTLILLPRACVQLQRFIDTSVGCSIR